MRLHPLSGAVLAAALAVTAATAAGARPVTAHHRVAHHRVAHHRFNMARPAAVPYGYLDGGEDPRYGYEEAPYDPNYHGPGAEVFAATKAEARASGLLHELEPDAKVSATGIVVGGGLSGQ